MLEKFKNLFKKKELDSETARKKTLTEGWIYTGIMILIFIIVKVADKNAPVSDNNQSEIGVQYNYKSALVEFENYNYNETITIKKDDETLKYMKTTENCEKEMLKDENDDFYFVIKGNYYLFDKEKMKLVESKVIPIYKNDDYFLINIENVIQLLSDSDTEVNYSQDKDYALTFSVKAQEVLDLYNEENKTNHILNDNIIIFELEYDKESEKVEEISYEITNVYNKLFDQNYNNIQYKLEFSDIGEVSFDQLKEYNSLIEGLQLTNND